MSNYKILFQILAKFKGRAAENAKDFLHEADTIDLLVSLVEVTLKEVTFDFTLGGKKCSVSFYGDGDIIGSVPGKEDFDIHNASKCLETIRRQ